MKRLSKFIKELEELQEKYGGDLPVVTNDPNYGVSIPNNDSSASFRRDYVWDSSTQEGRDCILIL